MKVSVGGDFKYSRDLSFVDMETVKCLLWCLMDIFLCVMGVDCFFDKRGKSKM